MIVPIDQRSIEMILYLTDELQRQSIVMTRLGPQMVFDDEPILQTIDGDDLLDSGFTVMALYDR